VPRADPYERYDHLAEQATPGPLRALFALLRDEEVQHAGEVRTRWSRLFSAF